MNTKKMSGKIIEVRGSPNLNSYIVENSEGNTFLVHVGDLADNEQFLYDHYKDNKTTKYKEGDSVEFTPDLHEHAIHVKKVA